MDLEEICFFLRPPSRVFFFFFHENSEDMDQEKYC